MEPALHCTASPGHAAGSPDDGTCAVRCAGRARRLHFHYCLAEPTALGLGASAVAVSRRRSLSCWRGRPADGASSKLRAKQSVAGGSERNSGSPMRNSGSQPADSKLRVPAHCFCERSTGRLRRIYCAHTTALSQGARCPHVPHMSKMQRRGIPASLPR